MWYHLSHPMFSLLRSSGLLLDSVYMEFLEIQMPCLTVKTAQCVIRCPLSGTGIPFLHIFHMGLSS